MKLLVFGANGMLGTEVCAEAKRQGWFIHTPVCDIADSVAVVHLREYNTCDAVINCAGIIPSSHRFQDSVEVIRSNSIGPRVIADTFSGRPVIHVSTDCVFETDEIPLRWFDSDLPNATDLYGRTKALGEPDNCIVVRTSFIGPKHGLLRWLLDQPRGSTIQGWTNAIWSGSTVYEVARHLVKLAGATMAWTVHHLASDPISKYELLRELIQIYDLKLTIEAVDSPRINRRLDPTIYMERSLRDLNTECQRSNPSRA